MPNLRICYCTICIKRTVPGTTEAGYPLDRRTWLKHNRRETRRATVTRARAVLCARDNSLLQSDPGDTQPVHPPPTSARAQAMTRKLTAIGTIQDEIAKEHRALDALVEHVPHDKRDIEKALSALRKLKSRGVELEANLRLSGKRIRQFVAVQVLHTETNHDMKQFAAALARSEKLLRRAQLEKEEEEVRRAQDPGYYNTDHHFAGKFGILDPILQLWMFMALVCNVSVGLSHKGCQFLLWMTHYIVQTCFLSIVESIEQLPGALREMLTGSWPRDIRTVRQTFQLDAKETIYAVCPSKTCHQTYAPDRTGGSDVYPPSCTAIVNKQTGAQCGETLCRERRIAKTVVWIPIKPYIVFDFKDWLSGLLSRPGYETVMDDAWHHMTIPANGDITSIFQAEILQNFKGPDGRHFGDGDGEGRYVFSLCGDWFNPLSNKLAGKRISCGVMMLVCQNLPPHLKHRPENVFVFSIMPGPTEVKLVVNPYLTPLINVFLLFWDVGVRFSRTFNHPRGRCVMCALVCVVCDLPAARKFGGFAACTHTLYCAVCFCQLPGSIPPPLDDDLDATMCPSCECIMPQHAFGCWNLAAWRRRENYQCRAHAEAFRSAPDDVSAQSSFDQTGVRYSNLLRLPYFDPTRFIVIDSMHNLFLGLLKEHFTNILGYNTKSKDGHIHEQLEGILPYPIEPSDSNPLPAKETERSSVEKLLSMLQRPTSTHPVEWWEGHYAGYHLAALKYVCQALKLSFPPGPHPKKASRANYSALLVAWRQSRTEAINEANNRDSDDSDGDDTAEDLSGLDHGKVMSKGDMEELWKDVKKTITPSWLTTVPYNLGDHTGKLKADQWRTAATVYYPITLTRLWSKHANVSQPPQTRKRHAELLSLTLSLISAINIATSRETSQSHADKYLHYMTAYYKGLKDIFPEYVCHPNHHQSMHLAEYLLLYGPVHGWWTFPMERVIGKLQRISTNYREGEYELTIGRTWHRRNNLTALFLKSIDASSQTIQYCAEIFGTLISTVTRGSLTSDGTGIQAGSSHTLSRHAKALPPELRRLFGQSPNIRLPHKVDFISSLTVDGLRYTTFAKHNGNGIVILRDQHACEFPARIENIIKTEGQRTDEAWIIVHRYNKAAIPKDPFADWPHVRARMVESATNTSLELLHSSAIQSHTAICGIPWAGKEVSVVISLNRVLLLSVADDSDRDDETMDVDDV